jgi:hypothetical protein
MRFWVRPPMQAAFINTDGLSVSSELYFDIDLMKPECRLGRPNPIGTFHFHKVFSYAQACACRILRQEGFG